jgi:hypothetical protein
MLWILDRKIKNAAQALSDEDLVSQAFDILAFLDYQTGTSVFSSSVIDGTLYALSWRQENVRSEVRAYLENLSDEYEFRFDEPLPFNDVMVKVLGNRDQNSPIEFTSLRDAYYPAEIPLYDDDDRLTTKRAQASAINTFRRQYCKVSKHTTYTGRKPPSWRRLNEDAQIRSTISV